MSSYAWYIFATIFVAISGYLFTYWNNLRMARQQARLELVNQRLDKFYGPLYIITKSLMESYQAQLKKLGRNVVYVDDKPLNKKEREENISWVIGVYQPLEKELSNLITHNAHLIREQEIPTHLLKLVAHVSATKALLYKWNEGDYSELYPAIEMPYDAMLKYSSRSYAELKAEQLKLIGHHQG